MPMSVGMFRVFTHIQTHTKIHIRKKDRLIFLLAASCVSGHLTNCGYASFFTWTGRRLQFVRHDNLLAILFLQDEIATCEAETT